MKKRILIILISVVVLAIGVPKLVSKGTDSLGSKEERKEVQQIEESFYKWSLRPVDRFLVQGYEIKPNGHQWNTDAHKEEKNYRVTYYSFFGIRYAEGEISKGGGQVRLPHIPFS